MTNISVRGIRASLPQGVILGRPANAGNGPATVLSKTDLEAMGLASKSYVVQNAGSIPVQDNGTAIGKASTLNFTGAGVTVTFSSTTADIAIAGAPTATASSLGVVEPDNSTITVNGSGVISATFAPAAAVVATISGSSITIQEQTNVSSITYTAVGRYRINFTSNLPNAYYAPAFAGRFPDEVGPVMPIINIDSTSGYGQTQAHIDVAVETAAGVIADLAQLSVMLFSAGSAPASTYLLDTLGVAASGAYSLRQLKSSATKAINVRRDSDNTTMDIGFVSGALDTTTLTTFVGSNGGWVTKWYDQSGNGNDLAQTNTSSQPQIVIAGTVQTNANGKSALFFRNGYATGMTNTASLLQGGAFTVSAAVQPNEVTSYPSFMGTPNPSYGDSVSFGVESASGNHYFALFCDGVGTANFTTPVNASASQILAVTSAAGVVTNTLTATGYVNNTSGGSATINTSNSVVSGTSVGVPADTTAEQWQGYMSEIIIWPSVLSSGNLTTVYNSQHGAW